MIENFFTEERRIQGLINEAVNKELKKAHSDEILHFAELNIPKEKIIEVTGFAPEFVETVLNKNNN